MKRQKAVKNEKGIKLNIISSEREQGIKENVYTVINKMKPIREIRMCPGLTLQAVENDETAVPQQYGSKNEPLAKKYGNEVEQLSVWEAPDVYGSINKLGQNKDDEK